MHEVPLLENTTFWYAVAVVTFVTLVVLAARKGVAGALDGLIASIRSELDEAKRLRGEAEATLADYRERQTHAIKEAEGIVADAKALAARLRREAEVDLQNNLKRHEEAALERIALVQSDAANEIRNHLMREALAEVRTRLEKGTAGVDPAQMIDSIIADLPKMAKAK